MTWRRDQFIVWHEGCGEIVEVGSSVHDWKVGDMVGILYVAGCGDVLCPECSRGFEVLCQDGECYGLVTQGSYAPYQAIKMRAAARLSEDVLVEVVAVATDTCLTAYHAIVGTGKAQKGKTVVSVGVGELGFNAMQEVLVEAMKFGVPEEHVASTSESHNEFVKRKSLVVDTVVGFIGLLETFNASQEAVGFSGKLVQVSLLGEGISITNLVAVLKHLSILCIYGGRMQHLEQCLASVASGELRPQVENRKLRDLPQTIEDLHAGKVKGRVALVPDHQE